MRAEAARYALVVYPNNDIGCIPLETVAEAETLFGAFVFAEEWDVIDIGIPLQSNPRRHLEDENRYRDHGEA